MAITTEYKLVTHNYRIDVIDGAVWISDHDGEGMEITPEQLDEILAYAMGKYF